MPDSELEIPATSCVRLRPYTAADEDALFGVFADRYARAFYPEMAERANVRRWIDWNLSNYEKFGLGLWAMEEKTEGRMIGDCGLTYQPVEGRIELEVGYHLLERERGKGYATEAARACLEFGFLHTVSERICSIVRPSNTRSCAVARRLHAQQQEFLHKGQACLFFFTTRREWEAAR